MERFCLLTFICFVIISSSESFIEEETLDGMVATLKLSVQGLQGRVAALENQCGKSQCNTKTYLYNFDPIKPHFYILFFLFLAKKKHILWVLVRTASTRRF